MVNSVKKKKKKKSIGRKEVKVIIQPNPLHRHRDGGQRSSLVEMKMTKRDIVKAEPKKISELIINFASLRAHTGE